MKNSKKKKAKVEWTEEYTVAFEKLKELCCTTPILAYADYQKKFILYTNVSDLGLGAVLYQIDKKGKKRVIAYASRSLSPLEKNYTTHKLEFLALKWFHEYLWSGGGIWSIYW